MHTCIVPTCGRLHQAHGFCSGHYQRWLLKGDVYQDIPLRPLTPRKQRLTFEERFWTHVDTSADPDACWPWMLYITPAGYGQSEHNKVKMTAHRMAYLLHYQVNIDGLHIDHTCHTRACTLASQCPHRRCCNPLHLEAVTMAVNIQRGNNWHRGKTHCSRGHLYTPATTGYNRANTTTGRFCKTCLNLRQRNARKSR